MLASTTTTILELAEEHRKVFPGNEFTIPFITNHLQNLADDSIKAQKGYDYDHLLFSYHGIPERHIRKTDIITL
jgi:ferrochelatase